MPGTVCGSLCILPHLIFRTADREMGHYHFFIDDKTEAQ